MSTPVWVKLIAVPLTIGGFLFGGIVAVGSALEADTTGAERQTSQSVDMPGSGDVSIAFASGSVTVLAGDPGKVILEEVDSVRAPTRRLAERGLDRLHTAVSVKEDGVHVEQANSGEWLLSLHTDRKLTVRVPRLANVRVESSSGAIEIAGVGGDIIVNNSAGAVSVRDVDVARQLTVHQNSGAISFSGSLSTGSVDLRNLSGAVLATIPVGTNAHLEASTVNGPISIDHRLGLAANRTPGSGQHASGALGSGGPASLSLSTVSGPILVAGR